MSLFDLLGTDQNKPSGKVETIAVAVVTNNKDPDGLGRVKLKLPWKEGDDESFWARVATLMAGKERGSFFLPEVGDEVLVAFAFGDIGHPYVIGGLWNGKDAPPDTNSDGKNNIRMIKTRSGHQIIFNDDSENKAEKLEIRSKSGHTIVLDDADGSEKIQIKDKAEATTVLIDSAAKSISISSDKIELKDNNGSNKIAIDGAGNSVTIESAAQLEIKAKQIDIKADSAMNLKGGAMMKIEGSLVQIN